MKNTLSIGVILSMLIIIFVVFYLYKTIHEEFTSKNHYKKIIDKHPGVRQLSERYIIRFRNGDLNYRVSGKRVRPWRTQEVSQAEPVLYNKNMNLLNKRGFFFTGYRFISPRMVERKYRSAIKK